MNAVVTPPPATITPKRITNATAESDETLAWALSAGRRIHQIVQGVLREHERIGKRPVSLLEIATGSWAAAIGIDFPSLTDAELTARRLVETVGADSTVEIENDDIAVACLLDAVVAARQLVAPLQSVASPKKLKGG